MRSLPAIWITRGLEWTIGEWLDVEPSGSVGHISFVWAPGDNFIVSTRTEDFKDVSMLRRDAVDRLGCCRQADPLVDFQADGGTDQSTWTGNGNSWSIKTDWTLANGSKVSSTSVITLVDKDDVAWQMKDQKVDGKEMPDTREVKMSRMK